MKLEPLFQRQGVFPLTDSIGSTAMKRVFGNLAIVAGLFLGGWVFYVIFSTRQLNTEDFGLAAALVATCACLRVGWRWRTENPSDPSSVQHNTGPSLSEERTNEVPPWIWYFFAVLGFGVGVPLLLMSVPLLWGKVQEDFQSGVAGTWISLIGILGGMGAIRAARR